MFLRLRAEGERDCWQLHAFQAFLFFVVQKEAWGWNDQAILCPCWRRQGSLSWWISNYICSGSQEIMRKTSHFPLDFWILEIGKRIVERWWNDFRLWKSSNVNVQVLIFTLHVALCALLLFLQKYYGFIKQTVLSAGCLGDIFRKPAFSKALYSYHGNKAESQRYLYLVPLPVLLLMGVFSDIFLFLYENIRIPVFIISSCFYKKKSF